jgi:hypothetical protein
MVVAGLAGGASHSDRPVPSAVSSSAEDSVVLPMASVSDVVTAKVIQKNVWD